ncbi:efflux RND transporter periplasmic adaptor subunit [Ferrimonas pelagia]|uniref:Efflux RND transporter periplasmic adaptor subunit n=2 Tax=Ferrimonas pelagia TaxID=1177826 RepID=A0ABP9FAB5_9GAMM
MDTQIARPSLARRFAKPAIAAAIVILALASARAFQNAPGGKRLTLPANSVQLATVSQDSLAQSISLRGTVVPRRTIYLDAIEGGRVEQRLVEPGIMVTQGQPLVVLSNSSLQLNVMSREADVAEQLNNLSNTRMAMDTERLNIRTQLLEIDHQIRTLSRQIRQYEQLKASDFISTEAMEQIRDSLTYYQTRRELVLAKQSQDKALREQQIRQLEESTQMLTANLQIARQNLEGLTITAPADGFLSSLEAEQGESKSRGARLGQLDLSGDFKLSALVDEFYLSQIATGMGAWVEIDGQRRELVVSKISGRISNSQFEIELDFVDDSAEQGLRRGQTLSLVLMMESESSHALVLPKGAFTHHTGGHWIFVLDANGKTATRREIRLGRQSGSHLEVLSGLQSGDQVVISSYQNLQDIQQLQLSQ